MKTLFQFCAFSILSLALAANACATSLDSQIVTVARSLQIPGQVLDPDTYQLSLEDRLKNRTILGITNKSTGAHCLLLAVPNSKIAEGTANDIVLFPALNDSKQILRGWNCSTCAETLELVYPKAEAIQITALTGQSVLAADPVYDKLPPNLSVDDMKVVTLWLLSHERISNRQGVGLKAVHFVPHPTAPNRLPETASSTPAFALAGIALLLAYLAMHLNDRRRTKCWD